MYLRLSQEIDSIENTMQTKIIKAINSAKKFIPKIQSIVWNLPLKESSFVTDMSICCHDLGDRPDVPQIKSTKKDSKSAHDVREDTDQLPYTIRDSAIILSPQKL